MKNVLMIAVLLLLCSINPAIAQFIRGIYDNEKINGHVISVKDIECFKKPTGAVDSNISVINYSGKGEAINQLITKGYDSRFPKPAIPVNAKVSEHNWKAIFEYHYDKNGRLSTVTFTRDKNHGVFKYNKKGEPVEMITYEPDGSLVEKNQSTYDAQGNLFKTEITDAKGAILTQKYKYDSTNRLIMETFYDVNADKSNFYFKYESFDVLGNWTRYIYLNSQKHEISTAVRQIKYAD